MSSMSHSDSFASLILHTRSSNCLQINNNNNNNTAQTGWRPFVFFTRVALFMAESSWQPMMSAAQRRRQRSTALVVATRVLSDGRG